MADPASVEPSTLELAKRTQYIFCMFSFLLPTFPRSDCILGRLSSGNVELDFMGSHVDVHIGHSFLSKAQEI